MFSDANLFNIMLSFLRGPTVVRTIMTSSQPQGFLRQRNPTASPKTAVQVLPEDVPKSNGTRPKHEEIVWGKTPGGEGMCRSFSG